MFELDVSSSVFNQVNSIYNMKIWEDTLPGTVLTTMLTHDLDSSKSLNLDIFNLNGHFLNQFSIWSDGKIYTRLLLNKNTPKT